MPSNVIPPYIRKVPSTVNTANMVVAVFTTMKNMIKLNEDVMPDPILLVANGNNSLED